MPRSNASTSEAPLYERIADGLADQITGGAYGAGDRLPSLRHLSHQMRVSLSTVTAAYQRLEARGLIASRPQSGYYVLPRIAPSDRRRPRACTAPPEPTPVGLGELILSRVAESADDRLIQLGAAIPNPELLPTAQLLRLMASEGRRTGARLNAYAPPEGEPALRVQIARRIAEAGCLVRPDEIVVTGGATEAAALTLRTLCKPGDIVAVEGPTYFGFLHTLEMQGLRALAIPCDADRGIDVDALAFALERFPVRACLFNMNFSNPLGCVVPDAEKVRLLDLLARHGVPLIEDDTHGELGHDGTRPRLAAGMGSDATVIACSSFSKTLAPGFRVGWTVPGAHARRILHMKAATTLCSPRPAQVALARYLEEESFERHLRRIRRIYGEYCAAVREAVLRYFPAGTRATRPKGGFVVWVELPAGVDALGLTAEAAQIGVTLAPGALFSAAGRYPNFLRFNCAFWSERTDQALRALGALVSRAGRQTDPPRSGTSGPAPDAARPAAPDPARRR